jgi:hypothetical protein
MVNQFVCIERGMLNSIVGRVIDVDTEVVEVQVYDHEGQEDGRWIIAIPAITAFSINERHLEELALTVTWSNSPDDLQEQDIQK